MGKFEKFIKSIKSMQIKLITYWVCQFTGWFLFAVVFSFGLLGVTGDAEFLVAIRMFFIGIFSTHIMRWVIKKNNILDKIFVKQLMFFIPLVLVSSVIFTIFMDITSKGYGEIGHLVVSGKDFYNYLNGFILGLMVSSFPILIWGLIYFVVHYIKKWKDEIGAKSVMQAELIELEAKALRAQMNPHFIFNSMNSIKSLINKNDNDNAANYLTTFSKLIRTLFQNSDKREVSLYEELETCKFYTQLEKMRFGNKVAFKFEIDETIDLKDFKVPALILQPFIENAIWHGLMAKENGGKVDISVNRSNGAIQCVIEDNGIGREASKMFKPHYESTYQSRAIGLTQSRLELDKLLNEREDAIFIVDKEDEYGRPEGTKVILTFKEN